MLQHPILRADEIVVGCVTENNPKYLGQALRLVQSIRWFGGELSRARVVVGAVESIDARARRAIEALDAEIRIVPRFHARNGSSNRLRMFEELRGSREQQYLLLDCDTLVVRDPLPLLRRDLFQAKIAPFPTVTHEVFERLFGHFGLPLPARTYTTGYSGTLTIPYFNAGVFSISAALAERLAAPWGHYNDLLADSPELVAPCEKHLHQAALSLALAASAIPVAELGAEMNYQLNATHVPAPPGYLDIDPYIIHYHDLADENGMLLACPFPRAQERIDRFHERWRDERWRGSALDRYKSLPQSSPKQIAVIGMHRSGTSIVAQLLGAMGCYAGEKHELPPADIFNPTGYWEHSEVVALDEDILKALDASWLDPARADITRLDEAALHAFLDRARKIVRGLDERGSWMIKDPRLALLFPLWRKTLDRPICVLVSREPSAVARSLAQRDGLPLLAGLALWEEYTRAMLAFTSGLPRVCVFYEELLSNPIECVGKLHRDLQAAGAIDLQLPAADEVLTLVDPAFDRHRGDDDGLMNQDQVELRHALRSGAALEWQVVPSIHPETRNLLAERLRQERQSAALAGRQTEIDLLRAEQSELEKLLDAVFASRSWRIGFGVTRLWRRFVPSARETAEERWKRLPRKQ